LYGINARKIFSRYSVNEIKMFLSVKDVEGEQKPQSIGTKFVDFTARRVREVMVPRPFVKAVEVNTPLRNLIRIIHENGYSRMPVYRSDFDNALGILHVKDIIGLSEPFWLEQHLRKPFFIPETATVQAAFQNMQRNHVQLALVVDEYGGVDGIVSMEDLIEELIGEIQDEYDEEVQMLQRISERHWILEGNATLKEVNANLNIDLPENSSYTTIAGFLISILDRIPAEKDEIRYGDLLFTIEKMVGYKISKISVHLPQPAETATEQTR
jgi:putative hemolysin